MQAVDGGTPRDDVRTAAADLVASLSAIVAFFSKEAAVDLLDTVEALDLTVNQIRVLHHLDESDGDLTVKEAAESVGMSVAAMSRSLDGLVHREYVQRREDGVDRRMRRVRITGLGRGAIRRSEAVNKGVIEGFVRTLPAAERDRLAAALAFLLERPEIAICRPPGEP